MDAIECLVTRRSIRNYTKEPVSAGDIEKCGGNRADGFLLGKYAACPLCGGAGQ